MFNGLGLYYRYGDASTEYLEIYNIYSAVNRLHFQIK